MPAQDDRPYLAIVRRIQAGIAEGTWSAGQALPTRGELMRRYRVARATVDRAVDFLVQAGALESRQGAGTFVCASQPGPRVAVVGTPLPVQDLPPGAARLTFLGYEQVATASQRQALARFDGLLWNRPEESALAWAGELQGRVPQVLVNRVEPGFPCVSTDHRGAYRAIVGERLDQLPQARPVLLRKRDRPSLVCRYREEGFTDACRERERFYESLPMPDDFAGRLAALDALAIEPGRPLLMASDMLAHTGAVVAWARARGLAWRRDLWYSDFDDDLGEDVWGVAVTSFIQEERQVHAAALAKLAALIAGRDPGPEHELVPPRRRDGGT